MSNRRHRWLAGAMAGFVALAAALSFAPKPIPAVPPPVRLQGEVDTTTNPTQNELVVIPAPSIDLGGGGPATTTTTEAPAGPPPVVDDAPSQGPGGDDSGADDSADSIDDSADSPDD